MRFGESVIQGDRLARVELRLFVSLVNWNVAVVDVQGIRVGESGIRQRVSRIERNRLLEVFDSFDDSFRGALVPRVAAAEIQSIGLHIFRVATRWSRSDVGEGSRAERRDDRARDLVLDRENVVQLAI